MKKHDKRIKDLEERVEYLSEQLSIQGEFMALQINVNVALLDALKSTSNITIGLVKFLQAGLDK